MNKPINVSLSLLLIISALTPQPSSAKSSCQATINSVVNDIKKRGVITVFVYKKNIPKRSGNPTTRQQSLDFLLSPWQRNYEDLYSKSPKIRKSMEALTRITTSITLMKTYSDKIVNNCNNIASVSFTTAQTDDTKEYAIQSNGKNRLRDCVFSADFAPVPNSISWNQMLCF